MCWSILQTDYDRVDVRDSDNQADAACIHCFLVLFDTKISSVICLCGPLVGDCTSNIWDISNQLPVFGCGGQFMALLFAL